MPDDTRQCFKDCGLTDGSDDDTVVWWDRATSNLRSERSRLLNIIGRKAERLSLNYERPRTGKEPLWHEWHACICRQSMLRKTYSKEDKWRHLVQATDEKSLIETTFRQLRRFLTQAANPRE